jgi:hypothetical protein
MEPMFHTKEMRQVNWRADHPRLAGMSRPEYAMCTGGLIVLSIALLFAFDFSGVSHIALISGCVSFVVALGALAVAWQSRERRQQLWNIFKRCGFALKVLTVLVVGAFALSWMASWTGPP